MKKSDDWIRELIIDSASTGLIRIREWEQPTPEIIRWFHESLALLDKRRYCMLEYRYDERLTYREIAERFRISPERVRQIIEDSKRKMREAYRRMKF